MATSASRRGETAPLHPRSGWMMRTDFKIGFVGSLVVVVVASWYFARNEGLPSAIPITANDEILPLSARMADDAAQLAHQRREESGRAFHAETVAPPIDESIEDTLTTAAVEGYVDKPSLGDLFTAALGSEPDSGLDEGLQPASTNAGSTESILPLPLLGERFETHTIQAGDTIAQLARIYYGDVRYVGVLLRANPLVTDPANIPIGMAITIPEVGEVAALPPTSADTRPFTESPLTSTHTHVVRKGDTLYTIARRRLNAAARWKEIYELNKAVIGEDPNQLPLGAALALPR